MPTLETRLLNQLVALDEWRETVREHYYAIEEGLTTGIWRAAQPIDRLQFATSGVVFIAAEHKPQCDPMVFRDVSDTITLAYKHRCAEAIPHLDRIYNRFDRAMLLLQLIQKAIMEQATSTPAEWQQPPNTLRTGEIQLRALEKKRKPLAVTTIYRWVQRDNPRVTKVPGSREHCYPEDWAMACIEKWKPGRTVPITKRK